MKTTSTTLVLLRFVVVVMLLTHSQTQTLVLQRITSLNIPYTIALLRF